MFVKDMINQYLSKFFHNLFYSFCVFFYQSGLYLRDLNLSVSLVIKNIFLIFAAVPTNAFIHSDASAKAFAKYEPTANSS